MQFVNRTAARPVGARQALTTPEVLALCLLACAAAVASTGCNRTPDYPILGRKPAPAIAPAPQPARGSTPATAATLDAPRPSTNTLETLVVD